MSKGDAGSMVSAKLPNEVIEAYTDYAVELATSRSALFLEALEAYLPLLRAGRRTFREVRLSDGKGAA